MTEGSVEAIQGRLVQSDGFLREFTTRPDPMACNDGTDRRESNQLNISYSRGLLADDDVVVQRMLGDCATEISTA